MKSLLKDSRSSSGENRYGTVADNKVEEGDEDIPQVMKYGVRTKKWKIKRVSSTLRVVAMTILIVLAVVRSPINCRSFSDD